MIRRRNEVNLRADSSPAHQVGSPRISQTIDPRGSYLAYCCGCPGAVDHDSNPMNITVILCTYQRCNSLKKALQSVAGSVLPSAVEWEVLVVDNNSTDGTPQVVEEFSRRYPGRFRYLFEPKPGKSFALNSGIREAHGDVLAFMDDDVTVEPTWLQKLTAVLESDDWAGIGGRILPEQDFTPPRWLSLSGPHDAAPLALWERGLTAMSLFEPPFGTNMAFKRRVFEQYGGFRTDLGPRPDSKDPQKSEDSEFSRRLLAGGERLYYEPAAVVYHPVLEERVCKQYFLRWWFDKSRAEVRVAGIRPGTKWFFQGVPLYMYRRFVFWVAMWMVAWKPATRFSNKLKVWRKAGEIVEAYRQAHKGKQNAQEEVRWPIQAASSLPAGTMSHGQRTTSER